MSRSLRTRPQTLYQQNAAAGGTSDPHALGQNLLQKNVGYSLKPGSKNEALDEAARGSRISNKAATSSSSRSKVSSSLKKRLSTRYKDGADPLQEHIFRMASGSDSIPEVPEIPTELSPSAAGNTANSQNFMDAALSIPGFGLGQNAKILAQGIDPVLPEESPFPSGAGRSNFVDASSSSSRAMNVFTPSQRLVQTRSGGSSVLESVGNDLSVIGSERFEPQAYLRAISADEGASRNRRGPRTRDALLNLKDQAALALQEQVCAHYNDFIDISKEVAGLENDMLELKELIREWASLPAGLDTQESLMSQGSATMASLSSLGATYSALSSAQGTRLTSRSSIQDLNQVYKAQLQAMWENIEGSQKMVPFSSGRHVIAEAPNFVEMNSATYRPRQPVSLFLLDDLLLVASRKRRQMSSRVQLAADRCFNLSEIVVIDLKDASDLSNAIKIKRGKEVYVYRTDRLEEKKALLGAFRRVAEELAAKRRQRALDTSGASKRDSMLSPPAAAHTDASSLLAEPEQWASRWSDQVSVAIALRDWESAVDLIESGKQKLSQYSKGEASHAILASALRQHSSALVGALSAAMTSPASKKSAVVRYAGFLLRLDSGEIAREIFLNARSEMLRRRCRQIRFEGDVTLFISELALVHFTIIKNTSEWYMSAFKDNRMASGFIKWAAMQMELYAESFRKQVYGSEESRSNPGIIAEALDISLKSAAQLKEVGLDFTFLMQYLLRSPD